MKQWIAALERVAQTSHWTRKNRFDSFAPIRLNVAAQWLVDGVSIVFTSSIDIDDESIVLKSATTSGTYLVRSCWRKRRSTSMVGGCRQVLPLL
jgi:hypothetical protein